MTRDKTVCWSDLSAPTALLLALRDAGGDISARPRYRSNQVPSVCRCCFLRTTLTTQDVGSRGVSRDGMVRAKFA